MASGQTGVLDPAVDEFLGGGGRAELLVNGRLCTVAGERVCGPRGSSPDELLCEAVVDDAVSTLSDSSACADERMASLWFLTAEQSLFTTICLTHHIDPAAARRAIAIRLDVPESQWQEHYGVDTNTYICDRLRCGNRADCQIARWCPRRRK